MKISEVNEISRALKAVTDTFPQPWHVIEDEDVEDWEIIAPSPVFHPAVRTVVAETSQNAEVAHFIANAPRWITKLLLEVEAS